MTATAVHLITAALAAAALLSCVRPAASGSPDLSWCEAAARTTAGWVCGTRRPDATGAQYASFRGVPYATQPLGELRFKELPPPKPWDGVLNTTTEGPVCPQTDVFYGSMMQALGGMAEGCIHANIHVPLQALPDPKDYDSQEWKTNNGAKLPILVYIHGGGFSFGSGDADLYGPEYLVSKGVIVITFNYRLNAFGFLSLNSSSIPGNNGLRDCVQLLRWVRDNAAAFGGDAGQVTLAGQSAGGVMAHVLGLVPATKGLVHRVIAQSGNALSDFTTMSPVFAKMISTMFLTKLAIDPLLDPEEIHRQLVDMPVEKIIDANKELIDMFGLTTFLPVVESPHDGVTPILLEEPEVLIDRGSGKDIPLMISYTSDECQIFRPRFEEIGIISKLAALPVISVSPRLSYYSYPANLPIITKLIHNRYFNRSVDLDSYMDLCTDMYYRYSVLKVAEKRAITNSGPTYAHTFSYKGLNNPVKRSKNLDYEGVGHVEDISYMFRVNSIVGALQPGELGHTDDDAEMRDWMTDYIVKFMSSSESLPTPQICGVTPLPVRVGLWKARPAAHANPNTQVENFFDHLYTISRATPQDA